MFSERALSATSSSYVALLTPILTIQSLDNSMFTTWLFLLQVKEKGGDKTFALKAVSKQRIVDTKQIHHILDEKASRSLFFAYFSFVLILYLCCRTS